MARNTLSKAERYHPKGKIKQITTKLSPSVCDFQRYKPPAYCVASVPAQAQGEAGTKVCFVSLIYSFIVLLSFVGNFQKRVQIRNLVSKYRVHVKLQRQSLYSNKQTKQTKKYTTTKKITNHYARGSHLLVQMNSYKQSVHKNEQKLDRKKITVI